MNKYFTQSEKSRAIFNSLPPELRDRLEKSIAILEEKAEDNPVIAKMLEVEQSTVSPDS